MATLKTVIRIEAQGADDAIRKTRAVGKEVEDFTKKLNRADFSVISDIEKKLRSANFGTGTRATDALKAVSNQIALTRQQALTLTYTFNDVAASLASGASPFTILLQQGGQVTQAFGGIRGTVSALTPIVVQLAPAIAAVGAAVAAVSFLKMGNDAAKAAVEMRNLADRANVSFEAFQKITGVASIKGIAKEDTSAGLERLSQSLGKAAKSYRELGEAANKDDTVALFNRLGVEFRGFTGRSGDVERAIRSLARGINTLSGQDRFDAIQQLRSLVGPEFAQFILRSGRSIEQLARQYGVAANELTKADLAIAEQQTQAAAAFGDAWSKAATRIGSIFTPATLAATRFLETIRSSGSGTFEPLKAALTSVSETLRDFFLILSGNPAAAQRSPAIAVLVSGLSAVGAAARIAAGAVGKAFDAVVIVAEVAAAAINDVFGTSFSTGATIATTAIGLVIAKMTGLLGVITAVGAAFAGLAASAALNPWVIGIAAVAGLLLTIVANIGSVKDAFNRLAEDFDVAVVQRARVWLKLLEAGAAFRPWNTAAYSKAVDDAIALEFKRQDAVSKITARRVEEDKRAAEQGKTVLGNTVDFAKGLWADSGAKTFMDEVVAQIGRAAQSLGGLSGRAKTAIADVRNAGNAAAGAANQAVQDGFIKVAPGRWKSVFDEAQAQADQFVKTGAGRWKQALDGAQAETSRFVKGADGFWRLAADGADQAAAAADRAATAIRRAKEEQAAPATAAAAPLAQTAQQAPAVQQIQQAADLTGIATAQAAVERLRQLIAQALQEAQNFAAGSVILVTNSIQQLVTPASAAIDSLNSALARAIENVNKLAGAVAALPTLPNYSGSNQAGMAASGGMASGGLVSGPGTGTSDSILARLSSGEFVVRAAAVRHYGVDFLRRLNGISLSAPKVGLAMPRFAMGGLVQPGFAGAQSGGRPVTLVLDGKSFGPFTAGGDVIGAVEKHVSMRKLSRTTARVPSRIG